QTGGPADRSIAALYRISGPSVLVDGREATGVFLVRPARRGTLLAFCGIAGDPTRAGGKDSNGILCLCYMVSERQRSFDIRHGLKRQAGNFQDEYRDWRNFGCCGESREPTLGSMGAGR